MAEVPKDIQRAVAERCVRLGPGSKSQYDDAGVECGPGTVVDAIYVESPVPGREHDPYSCCLPLPACDAGDAGLKQADVAGYSRDAVKAMSTAARVVALAALAFVRVCLPFLLQLEAVVGHALRDAYKSRTIGPEGVVMEAAEKVGDLAPEQCAWCDELQGVNGGPNVHGIAGCGKTSAVGAVLSRYPQVVVHRIEGLFQSVQVVWLMVNCHANSDLGSLFDAIGAALDRALHTEGQPYQTYVERAKRLGAKAKRVTDLLTTFSVGMLVLDEAQVLGHGNRTSSFHTLAQVVNKTGIELCLVGTEETPEILRGDLYLQRRADMDVKADAYRTDPYWGDAVVAAVARYTWTLSPIELTDAGKAALRTCTGGSAGLIVDVWKRLQIDLIERERDLMAAGEPLPPKWKVGPNKVRGCFSEHFGGISRALDEIDTKEGQQAYVAAVSAEARAFQDKAATLQQTEADAAAREAEELRAAKELEAKVADAAAKVAALAPGLPAGEVESLCRDEAANPCAGASDIAIAVLQRLSGRGSGPVPKAPKRRAPKPSKEGDEDGIVVPKGLSDTFTTL